MRIVRIILGAIAMFLCVIFFVSFVAAIFGAWAINRSLSDAAIGLLVPIEHVAGQAWQAVDDLDDRLQSAQGEVDALRSDVENLTVELQQNRDLRASIAATLTARLEPVVQVVTQDLSAVRDGLTAINTGVDAINRLPLIDLNVPRLERLQEIENDVAALTAQLTELKASGERLGTAAQEVLPQVSEGLETLSTTASTAQGRLDEVKTNIDRFTGRLETLKQEIATGFNIVTWAEIFVLAWLAISQVSLLSHAYQWARKP